MKALYAVLSPLKEGENGNKQGQIRTPQCHINKSIRWQDISLSHVIAGHDANYIFKKSSFQCRNVVTRSENRGIELNFASVCIVSYWDWRA